MSLLGSVTISTRVKGVVAPMDARTLLMPSILLKDRSPFSRALCLVPPLTYHIICRSHTKVAMEKPQKELYIRSSVAEALHEICLDSEVPPSQRKFERKRMSRQDVYGCFPWGWTCGVS